MKDILLSWIGQTDLNASLWVLLGLTKYPATLYHSWYDSTTKVDVRVIAATNRELPEMMAAGTFRADLYYRICIGELLLPPLRSRPKDIVALAEWQLNKVNEEFSSQKIPYKDKKFSLSAKKFIKSHHWPGNVRELFNTIKRACLWQDGAELTAEDMVGVVPKTQSRQDRKMEIDVSQPVQIEEILAGIEKKYIETALAKTRGHKRRSSALLGYKNYQTLTNRIRKLGIEV